jgi:hypothetical protein
MPDLGFLKSKPQTEVLRVESDPPNAEAKSSQGPSCRTPCDLTVEVSSGLSVTVSRDGYQPQTIPVALGAGPVAAGSRDADLLVTPPPPPRLDPNPLYVELVATRAAPAAKKPPVKKPKPKPPATAAQPAPASETAMAAIPVPSSGSLPPPPPSTEAAASASNYPWSSR